MKKLFEKWKKIAVIIADFQLRLLLTILYFIIILPYAIAFAIGRILKKTKKQANSCWIAHTNKKPTIDNLRRQS